MSPEEVERGDSYPWRGTDEGTQLSVSGTSGFDFLEAGRRNSDGSYMLINQTAYFWTSTEAQDTGMAWRRCLAGNDPGIGRWSTFPKTYGFSIRCLKNEDMTLENITGHLIRTYDKIDIFEADAEIVKVNPCNIMQNKGMYYYFKPESAMLSKSQVNPFDFM